MKTLFLTTLATSAKPENIRKTLFFKSCLLIYKSPQQRIVSHLKQKPFSVWSSTLILNTSACWIIFAYWEMINKDPLNFEKFIITFFFFFYIFCYLGKALMWHWCRRPNINGQREYIYILYLCNKSIHNILYYYNMIFINDPQEDLCSSIILFDDLLLFVTWTLIFV